MTADPLSAILSLIETRVVYSGGFSAGGAWAIRFPPPQKVKFFAIAHGSCFVTVDGLPDLFHLNSGDVFLLSAEAAFTVASDPALPPADAFAFFDGERSTFAHLGEGGDLLYLGSHLEFASKGSRLLIDNLPPVIHLSGSETGTGRLRWLIEELVRETTSTVPGTLAARSGLANLMFLQLLRGYLSQERGVNVGWLRAACDPKLAPALSLMHCDPARNWHLPELAKAAAMSRTTFATYFKAIAGIGPLSYLTEWRMWLAERKLREGGQSVSMIAHSVGYASEAAFSTAYKRVMGSSPRRQMRQATVSN